MANKNYYISTGSKDCYYTLRCSELVEKSYFDGNGTATTLEHHDYYITNLSLDKETAIRKASFITGYDMTCLFDAKGTFTKSQGEATIDSLLMFGKYADKTIAEVMDLDPEYLKWCAYNMTPSKHNAHILNAIQALYGGKEVVQAEIKAACDARDAEKAEQKARSQYQGTVNEKITRTVTLKKMFSFNTMFGVKYGFIMVDDEGNIYKWITTGDLGIDIDEKATIKATVSGHCVYDDMKQTELIRVKKV